MPGERQREHTGLKINLCHCQSEEGRDDKIEIQQEKKGTGTGERQRLKKERYKDKCD